MLHCGKIELDEFMIHKRLGKNPKDYPDAKSQPACTSRAQVEDMQRHCTDW
jgi:hypothetical protein